MATGTIKSTGWTLLWTNPNPSADFVGQTVTVDLSPYTGFAICAMDETAYVGTFIFIKSDAIGSPVSFGYPRLWGGGGALMQRFFSVTDTSLGFENGRCTTLPSTYSNNANSRAKPYKIYGIHL